MPEYGRFFDAVAYGEADQAEIQNRFRGTGVLSDVGNRLVVATPGGMFVSVSDGEAMVQGFWYKNTATLSLAIANNTSGSTRIDRVVLRLNRTTNILSAVVLQGTPGAGAPALTQVVGGIWEFPLAQVSVANGAVAIAAANITDQRTFSVGTLPTPTADGYNIRKTLTVDPATKELYFAEPAPIGPNLFYNSSFRANSRMAALPTTVTGTMVSDGWVYGTNNANIACGTIDLTPVGDYGSPYLRGLSFTKMASPGVIANDLKYAYTRIEGYNFRQIYNQYAVFSCWAYSNKAGTFAACLQNIAGGATLRYIMALTIPVAATWTYIWKLIPPNVTQAWVLDNQLAAQLLIIPEAGGSYTDPGIDVWTNSTTFAPNNISNMLTTNGDVLYVGAIKIEPGRTPSRYVTPHMPDEINAINRYMYIHRGPVSGVAYGSGGVNFHFLLPFPTEMRTTTPAFSSMGVSTFLANSPGANQWGILNTSLGVWVSGITYSSIVPQAQSAQAISFYIQSGVAATGGTVNVNNSMALWQGVGTGIVLDCT